MQNNTHPVMLFDKRFVANTLREFLKCLSCRNDFTSNFQRGMAIAGVSTRSNRPVLLPCGHSICENCVQQNYKNLVCPDCSRPLPIPKQFAKNFKFRTMFELNFFLLGVIRHLSYYRNECSFDTSMLLVGDNERIMNKKAKKNLDLLKCGECDKSSAFGKCSQCNVHYCKNCFERVHMNSKVLKAHSLTAFEKESQEKRFIKPRSKVCYHHRKICNYYCKKCHHIYCQICIKADHSNHHSVTLAEMNERSKDDIFRVLDTVKQSRENVRKAQREIKSVESQLQDFATQTLENISHTFLEMHGLLQLQYQKIVQNFSESCAGPQLQMREAYDTLTENLNILNNMRSFLEAFEKNSAHFNMTFVAQNVTKQLRNLETEVQISRIEKNPFIFETSGDLKRDLHNYCSFKYIEPDFSVFLESPYGSDRQRKMLNIMTENKKYPAPMQDFNLNSSEILEKTANLEADTFDGDMSAIIKEIIQPPPPQKSPTAELSTMLAQISFVKSPSYFFLQNVDLMPMLNELSERYVHVGQDDLIPKSITPNNVYMGYYEPTNRWHRIIVTKAIDENRFKTLLIDVGNDSEMTRKHIRRLDEIYANIAFGAIPCTLYNLESVDKGWSQEAKELMLDITRGKPVRAYIFGSDECNVKCVDLLTTNEEEPISIRDAFLYMGLAREKPGSMQTPSSAKKLHPVTPITEQYMKPNLRLGNCFNVKVTHVENPTEFFIIRADQEVMKLKLCKDLNWAYNQKESLVGDVIYFAPLKMCCAVRYKDTWYRGSVEEIEENGFVRVRFVDEGKTTLVKWNCLYKLEQKFHGAREMAVRCSLYELEPLQKNSYTWTNEATKEFNMLISNPNISLRVDQVIQNIYRVTMFVSKKNAVINIGAVLVRKGHAISTGPSTQTYEIQKKTSNALLDANRDEVLETLTNSHLQKSHHSSSKKIERSAIKITHIVDPGEFYFYLASVEEGVLHFHAQLQISQEATEDDSDDEYLEEIECKDDWSIGDHCLVQTIFRSSLKNVNRNGLSFREEDFPDNAEWFRAIIVDITSTTSSGIKNPHGMDDVVDEQIFTVFLRDKGATIKEIRSNQLRQITDHWDCVADTVTRCHLAYVRPNGDSNAWSMSSTDRFKENATLFHTLLVTKQGEPTADTNSIPVYLWGMTSDSTDPLGPTVSKYSNINRILLKMGLACQTESSVSSDHMMTSLIHKAVDSNQISLDDWFKRNPSVALLNAIERASNGAAMKDDAVPYIEEQPESLEYQEALRDFNDTKPTWGERAPIAWNQRKTISKTLFTAYPTYVNHSAEVFLHEASDNSILNTMRSELTEKFKNMPPDLTNLYTIGQPCVVKYHCDGAFYRGIITSADNRSEDYEVEFVDYGNEETVKNEELRPYAPYPNLISFATKYRIDGIRPVGGAHRYTIPALDVMHKLLVDKLVSVRVQAMQFKKKTQYCSFRIGSEDLADILVRDGRAEYKKNNCMKKNKNPASKISLKLGINLLDNEFNNNNDDLYLAGDGEQQDNENNDEDDQNVMENIDIEIENMDQNDDGAPNSVESSFELEKSMKTPKQQPPPISGNFKRSDFEGNIAVPTAYGLHQLHENNYSADEMDEEIVKNENHPALNLLNEPDADVVVLEESLISNYWQETSATDILNVGHANDIDECELALQWNQMALHQQVELESSCDFENFRPQDASTTLSHFTDIELFKWPKLPTKVRSFRCLVCSLVSPTSLYIFPLLKEFQDREKEVKCVIKDVIKTAKPLANFTTNTLCLARYSIDQNWYRAFIRSYDAEKLEAVVIFVDYWNAESVSIKNLKQCPVELWNYPLRTIRVHLHGLKPSLRMRKKDVCRALENVLKQNDDFFVQVQKHTEEGSDQSNKKDSIEVNIFESESSSNVVYYELIKQKYYTCTK